MKRICGNIKCKKDISEMRKDAKFCCRICKSTEGMRISNKQRSLNKYKEKELAKIEAIKRLKEIIENQKGTKEI